MKTTRWGNKGLPAWQPSDLTHLMSAEKKPITSAEAKARGCDPDTIAQLELDEEAHAEAALLIREIEAAFAGVPRPRITRSVAVGYDRECVLSEERVQELASQDPEQQWSEVSDEAMQSCQEYFCFSDAEGWRFYLPAYLCQHLREFPHASGDGALYACEAGTHLDLLTDEQMECVIRFLELCHRYEGTA